MLLKKLKRKNHKTFAIGLSILIIVLLFGFFKMFDLFLDEDRDYKLSDEIHNLARELKEYKKQNNRYPESILRVRSSDKLCVHFIYTKCRKVYYQPSKDLQDFKMAIKSFSWPILFYDPQISMTTDQMNELNKDELQRLIKQYGMTCTFCMAYPENEKNTDRKLDPVYRKDSKVFPNPQEWPKL